MDPNSVLSKTQKGAQEIETRANKLEHRLRALLIVVNGKSTAGEVAAKFGKVADVLPMLQQLVAQGFVAASAGAEELKRAQLELCTYLLNALGPDADAITAKVERCKSMDELRQFLGAQREGLDRWLGESKRAQFWARAAPYLK
jgi:hypothetical protein